MRHLRSHLTLTGSPTFSPPLVPSSRVRGPDGYVTANWRLLLGHSLQRVPPFFSPPSRSQRLVISGLSRFITSHVAPVPESAFLHVQAPPRFPDNLRAFKFSGGNPHFSTFFFLNASGPFSFLQPPPSPSLIELKSAFRMRLIDSVALLGGTYPPPRFPPPLVQAMKRAFSLYSLRRYSSFLGPFFL